MSRRPADTLRDGNGQAIRLGRLLKSGGAGSVYLIEGVPDQVAKIYHPQVDRVLYAAKVKAMLDLCPNLPDVMVQGKRKVQIAWPQRKLYAADGTFSGFAMPLLDIAATSDLEHVLNERQAREQGLPTSLGARITLAANLAASLSMLHARGHYVVDLKPLNLRLYIDSLLIALLDCDGYSIAGDGQRFPAQQYTADYLAPEFHGKGVPTEQEEAQDRFALAVLVFQLLNFGIHPYSGRPVQAHVPNDLPARIAGGFYAHARVPHRAIQPVPVSGHRHIPLRLRTMFDAAFGVAASARPTAAQWAQALAHYAKPSDGRLLQCKRNPAHQHFRGQGCALCGREQQRQVAQRAQHKQAAQHERRRARSAAHGAQVRGHQAWATQPAATPSPATAAPHPVAASRLERCLGAIAVVVLVPAITALIAAIVHPQNLDVLDALPEPQSRWVEIIVQGGFAAVFAWMALVWVFFAWVMLAGLLNKRTP